MEGNSTANKSKNRAPLGVLVFASMLCLLFGWLYSRNALFRLSEIEVEGVPESLKKEIQEKIIEYYGRGLFSISLGEIENKILILPQIEKISLHRRWPSKLMVEVVEKVPVALVDFKQNIWWVDKNGELVQIVQEPLSLPVIKGFHSKEDGTFLLPEAQSSEVFAWLTKRASQRANEVFKIGEISWDTKKGLEVKSADANLTVDLGFDQFESAWNRALLAYTYFKSKNLSLDAIDSSYTKRVVAHIKRDIKLQNSQNGLNLKELVRRTEQPLTNEAPATR